MCYGEQDWKTNVIVVSDEYRRNAAFKMTVVSDASRAPLKAIARQVLRIAHMRLPPVMRFLSAFQDPVILRLPANCNFLSTVHSNNMSRRESLTSLKNIALPIELARIAKLVPAVVGAVACTDGIGGNADVSSLVENCLHFGAGCC